MQAYFYQLADRLHLQLQAQEHFTLWLSGEYSDFIRFNHARVRQAGNVFQCYLTLQLIRGHKHVSQELTLSTDFDADQTLLLDALKSLRSMLTDVADDPHLLLAEQINSTEHRVESNLPPAADMVADIIRLARNTDLVGFLASGELFYGFANSAGQRNWHENASWNFDWSLYSHADKAVKRGSAGFDWQPDKLATSIEQARAQVHCLTQPPKTLEPGRYRAYLTPAALAELVSMLNWGGFSEKAFRTKQSALQKLAAGEQAFSSLISLSEHTQAGLAPAFQSEGFIKPPRTDLIQSGALVGSLISPRTAKEYGLLHNGADGGEAATSFDLAAGSLPQQQALKALHTGLYISNLWYLNYSDRTNATVTGMTRFACFWVEQGEIVAPLNVMRFDDSLYRLLGSQLEALTLERELLADAGTYGGRSCASQHVPGALLAELNLVL